MQWAKAPVVSFLSQLQSKTRHNLSGAKVIKFFNDSKVTCVILEGYEEDYNEMELKYLFHKNFYIGIEKINLLSLPNTWREWASSVFAGTNKLPKFKLKSGEVRVAAECDGEIKAVTLYK